MREGYYDYMLRRTREEEKKMSYIKDKYVMVDTISTYRMRYAISMEELKKQNTESIVDTEWAIDCVTCEEVEEFSQLYLGEQIIEHKVVDEEEMLRMFDNDNDYLKEWSRDQKIDHIRRSLSTDNIN